MPRRKGPFVADLPLDILFQKVLDFYHTEKRCPSFEEMKPMFDVPSKSGVFYVVKRMIAAGYLHQRKYGGAIEIARPYLRIPLLGTVGAPYSEQEGVLADLISLDEHLITDKKNAFLFVVSGDAMDSEGMKEGDVVVVQRTTQVQAGDVVVVSREGQWIMRYLRKKGENWVLEAGNAKYPPIHPEKDLVMDLVVKGFVRKLKQI